MILLACEESQIVTKAFRRHGFNAFSCDIQEPSGGHPEWHIKTDVFDILSDDWDMIIAFPPCTHLAIAGARWWRYKIADGRAQQGFDFFMKFMDLDCPKVAVENPRGLACKWYRQPDQVIQPWWFGHPYSKATCLWLKGLPPLFATQIMETRQEFTKPLVAHPERSKMRSKTFPGVAEAMAAQWGRCVE